MDYAIIENGLVVNIIVGPLPNGMSGVPLGERPVAIGDAYEDGVFLRNEQAVLTEAERIHALEARLIELQQQIES